MDLARWYRRRLGRRRWRFYFPRFPKIAFIFAVIAFLTIYAFYIIDKNLSPAIMTIAEVKAHQLANEAINKAIYDKVLSNVNYNDLIIVHKDSQQRITMMQANSVRIGKIISQANLEIKAMLSHLDNEILEVPLGQTTGSRILANYGPKIKVKISPYGSVDVKFGDEFQQAGINQVRHILYLNISTTVKIVIPTLTQHVVVQSSFPIAENIIVGEVPNTYLGLGGELTKKIIDQAPAGIKPGN